MYISLVGHKRNANPSWTSWLKVIHHEWASGLFECLDSSPELVPGSTSNIGGAAFTHVETVCRGIPCPPYDRNKEITCIVCTKWGHSLLGFSNFAHQCTCTHWPYMVTGFVTCCVFAHRVKLSLRLETECAIYTLYYSAAVA